MANEVAVSPSELLKSMSVRIGQVLPKMIDKSRFLQIVLEEFRKTPKLAQCETGSLIAAIVKCSREGLEPGEECYLIPRWNGKTKQLECVYQRGYPGVLALARRSKEFSSINVGIVRENDEYELVEGTENRLVIHRALNGRGGVLFYWAASTMVSGEKSFDILNVEEADEHKEKFAPRDKYGKIVGPWIDSFNSMAMKSVLLQHLKYKPRAYELANPISNEGVFRLHGNDAVLVGDEAEPQPKQLTAASIIGADEPDQAPSEQTSNKDMVAKYKGLIDMMKTPEEIDRWRSSIGTALARDLPNDDDQTAVYAYAEDAFQALK